MKSLFLLLGGGALLYWWYSQQATTATPATTTTTTPATTTTTPTTTTPATGYNSLASVGARVLAAGNAQGGQLTPDGWNYLLAQQSSVTPPDPLAVFGATLNRDNFMAFPQYWSAMSAYLAAHNGMAGLGLMSRGSLRIIQGGWTA